MEITPTLTLSVAEVTDLCQRALLFVKAIPAAADAVTDALVWCELHGVSSHGLNMLPTYMERAISGGIQPNAIPKVIHQRGAIMHLDGCGSFGQYIASEAAAGAIKLAREHGVGVVSIFNANHAGALGCFTQKLAKAGLLGFMVHNSNPTVAPFGGRKAVIGTNPISFAFPGRQFPVVVDLATSATAKGKLYELARSGDEIPAGLALNADGEPTTSLAEALKGILLPLGGPKGYSLAVAVEMLTGVLGGGTLGPDIPSFHKAPDKPQGVSMLVLAIDPGGIMPVEEFVSRTQKLEEKIKATPPISGFSAVQMPGEREAILTQKRMQEGIPIKKSIVDEINQYLSAK
jgi:LDH2 family malate/lactate/ureidoglycolate dehydrogenase